MLILYVPGLFSSIKAKLYSISFRMSSLPLTLLTNMAFVFIIFNKYYSTSVPIFSYLNTAPRYPSVVLPKSVRAMFNSILAFPHSNLQLTVIVSSELLESGTIMLPLLIRGFWFHSVVPCSVEYFKKNGMGSIFSW